MKRKSAVVEVRVGSNVLFRARAIALDTKTLLDSSVPSEGWIQTEVCGLLAMAAFDLAPNDIAKAMLRKVMGYCGHETDGEPETLTQEQFRALLGKTPPSVPDDLPF